MMKFFGLSCCQNTHQETVAEIMVPSSPIRTAKDKVLSAQQALAELVEGNARYVGGSPSRMTSPAELRTALAEHGQNPMAVVIGCADSRCPIEITFDAQPGDLFVLRNAGNACPCGEGSIVGSVEYAVGALGTQLLVVMGHTKCGAMVGAAKLAVGGDPPTPSGRSAQRRSALEQYLSDLKPAAEEAVSKLGASASVEEVAAAAIHVNVFRTIRSLLETSAPLREKVRNGGVELHGAVYEIETGKVKFLGQHPSLEALLTADHSIPEKERAESFGSTSTSASSPK